MTPTNTDPIDQLQDTNFHRESYHKMRVQLTPLELANIEILVAANGVEPVLRQTLREVPDAPVELTTRLAGFLIFILAHGTNPN